MKPPSGPVFLARASYRQRRLRDAVRMLPIFGTLLLILPLLQSEGPRTSAAVIYTFGCWVLLIAASALISRAMRPDEGAAPESDL